MSDFRHYTLEERQIFEQTACINCHTVSGTPADGRFGPDLTHLMSRTTIAAGATDGVVLSVAGSVYLAVAVNVFASLLAMAALLSYLFLYTPLKRKTPLCTLIGAFPGAMPPLIGWAAASGKLNFQAWTLYAMLFLWQFPHFMAIAWMYREDYARAGYLVLPPDDCARARFVNLQTVLPLLALVPLSLLPGLKGEAEVYFIGALLLDAGFLYYAGQFVLRKSNSAARRLLAASIIYLPALFVVMVLARG